MLHLMKEHSTHTVDFEWKLFDKYWSIHIDLLHFVWVRIHYTAHVHRIRWRVRGLTWMWHIHKQSWCTVHTSLWVCVYCLHHILAINKTIAAVEGSELVVNTNLSCLHDVQFNQQNKHMQFTNTYAFMQYILSSAIFFFCRCVSSFLPTIKDAEWHTKRVM